MGTSVTFPLHGYVTNNGYIVNCILVDDEGKSLSKGEELLIPFEQTDGAVTQETAPSAAP